MASLQRPLLAKQCQWFVSRYGATRYAMSRMCWKQFRTVGSPRWSWTAAWRRSSSRTIGTTNDATRAAYSTVSMSKIKTRKNRQQLVLQLRSRASSNVLRKTSEGVGSCSSSWLEPDDWMPEELLHKEERPSTQSSPLTIMMYSNTQDKDSNQIPVYHFTKLLTQI